MGSEIFAINKNLKDLSKKRFGRLTVLKRGKDYITLKGEKCTCWDCVCDCGNYTTVRGNALKGGRTQSCGCYKFEINNQKKKSNVYDLSGEYGIGYTSNTNKEFLFDIDDYVKISKYCWNENRNGYARACVNKKEILMHRYVLGVTDSKICVDHKCHNNLDNRKSMLRPTSCCNNTRNEKLAINNTSGITGVSWEAESNKWHSYIWVDGKTIHLGRHNSFNKAVESRISAENKYFGEFSYANSMRGDVLN